MATNNTSIINQTPTPLSSPQRKLPPKDTPAHPLNPNSVPFQPSSFAMNNIPSVSVSSPANSSYYSAQNDSTSLSNNSAHISISSSGSSSQSTGRRHTRRPRHGQARPSTSSNEAEGDLQQLEAEDEEGDEEDSESDVEIYLSTIDLNSSLIDEHPISLSFNGSSISFENTTSNVSNQIFNSNDDNLIVRPSTQNPALPDNSPTLPKSHTFATTSQPAPSSRPTTRAAGHPVHSPPPPAPLRQTVPLPDIGFDAETRPQIVSNDIAVGTRSDNRSFARPSSGQQRDIPEMESKPQPLRQFASKNGGCSAPSSSGVVKGSTPPTSTGSGGSTNEYSAPKLTIDTTSSINITPFDSSGLELRSPTDAKSPGSFTSDTKTTNVYINGLPPHFPEDQLYALAAPYGPIRSVRTFTRHVRDSESGYGFVLFETVDAAEKCIQSLRRYRNLHPTFSKTAHKIPGTYSSADLTLHPPSGDVLLDWQPSESGNLALEHGHDLAPEIIGSNSCDRREPALEASFKAKMESLHDPTSTNLYMEGLPLSIDEPTLAALVSPHKISSSRFFQTRLSNPPRIIAFVRLETRKGAEEVIERLHGRMVRGWNDCGSRISVRFADTAEQRELRRSERNPRAGDESPARLTIAQASLLNLRGQELQNSSGSLPRSSSNVSISSNAASSLPPPPILLDRLVPPSASFPASRSLSGYSDVYGAYNLSRPHTPPFAVDYTLVNGGPPISRAHSPIFYPPQQQLPPSPYHAPALLPHQQQLLQQQQQQLLAGYQQNQMDPQMIALFDSLRANGSPFQPNYTPPMHLGNNRHLNLDTAYQQANLGHSHVGPRLSPQNQLVPPPIVTGRSAVQARSGYTATEEYIMRAHVESQAQQQPAGLNYGDGVGSNPSINQIILRNQALRQSQQDYHLEYDDRQQIQDRRRPPPLDLSYQQGQLQQARRTDNLQRRERSDSLSVAPTANISVGVRGYRAQASVLDHCELQQQRQQYEEEGVDEGLVNQHSNVRQQPLMSSLQHILSPTLSNFGGATNSNGNAFQHAHLRSSTLPYRAPSRAQQRHGQTSSMSAAAPVLGHGRQGSQSQQSSMQQQHQYGHSRTQGSVNLAGNMGANDFVMNNHLLPHSEHGSAVTSPNMNDITITSSAMGTSEVSKLYLQAQRQLRERDQGNVRKTAAAVLAAGTYDRDGSGSNNTSPSLSIISPALSYSANTPASTLSPATPFFTSFGNGAVQIGGVADATHVGSNGKGNAVTMGTVQAAFESAKMRNGGQ